MRLSETEKKSVRFECLTRQSEMIRPFTLKTAHVVETEDGCLTWHLVRFRSFQYSSDIFTSTFGAVNPDDLSTVD